MPKNSKTIRWWPFAVPPVLLVVMTALLFSSGEELPPTQLGAVDVLFQGYLTQRVAKEVFNKNPLPESTLRLSPGQVKSLLNLGDVATALAKAAGRYEGPELRYFHLTPLADGSFSCDYRHKVAGGWLFGGHIRLRGRFKLQKDGAMLTLTPLALRAGAYPLPVSWCGELKADLNRYPDAEGFNRVISRIAPENGAITVVYHPAAAAELLFGRRSGFRGGRR